MTAIGRPFFGHKSPAARELLKPSTDSASLLIDTEKKRFLFSVGGFLEMTSQWEHVLEILVTFGQPWAQPFDPFYWLKV